jgi:hypothetical protein
MRDENPSRLPNDTGVQRRARSAVRYNGQLDAAPRQKLLDRVETPPREIIL